MARITIVFITVLDLIPKQTKINAKLQNFNFKPEIFIFEFSRKQPLYKLPFYEIYFCAFPSKIKISVKNLNFEFFGNIQFVKIQEIAIFVIFYQKWQIFLRNKIF